MKKLIEIYGEFLLVDHLVQEKPILLKSFYKKDFSPDHTSLRDFDLHIEFFFREIKKYISVHSLDFNALVRYISEKLKLKKKVLSRF